MQRLIIVSLAIAGWTIASAQEAFDFRSEERPEYPASLTVDELEDARANDDVTVLDIRLAEDFAADPQLIPGALYKDPDKIAAWASDLPPDQKVVVYCVRGKWVSHKAADYLSREGYDVAVLEGGLEAWKAAQP